MSWRVLAYLVFVAVYGCEAAVSTTEGTNASFADTTVTEERLIEMMFAKATFTKGSGSCSVNFVDIYKLCDNFLNDDADQTTGKLTLVDRLQAVITQTNDELLNTNAALMQGRGLIRLANELQSDPSFAMWDETKVLPSFANNWEFRLPYVPSGTIGMQASGRDRTIQVKFWAQLGKDLRACPDYQHLPRAMHDALYELIPGFKLYLRFKYNFLRSLQHYCPENFDAPPTVWGCYVVNDLPSVKK